MRNMDDTEAGNSDDDGTGAENTNCGREGATSAPDDAAAVSYKSTSSSPWSPGSLNLTLCCDGALLLTLGLRNLVLSGSNNPVDEVEPEA